ncbi:uncharacterized protein LOC123274747 [Cotesia glomerata]|uniref:MADF domain-containing protein n=1 Tax=Cotesia glomerata TaxID=32391 RepID=A0AAV7J5I7_COTGL|nr:uncharacterized protein LOC123274747 [Cotesia glomerata]KAH0566978.1 hypothetical protein KQX54_005853 [Cotesia glomerata]
MTSVKKSSGSTNRLATEKFIERVKKNPCLYDNEVKRKSSPKDIDFIWKQIADDSGLLIGQAKRKWSYLVETYKASTRNDPTKKCYFKRELNFLIAFVQEISADEIQETGRVIKTELPHNDPDSWSEISTSRNKPRSSLDDHLPSTSSAYQPVRGPQRYSSTSVPIDINDEMMHFFISMCCTAKTLPRDLQIQIKSKISELINGAELTAMQRDIQ